MKLVTAIMPTRGRQEWAHQALQSFLSQTYENKQIVIADDTEDPSFDNFPRFAMTSVWYVSIGGRSSIPVKRNLCCGLASGEIIMHWDSDDWSASERMADQVARLEASGKEVTGYHSMLFHEEETGRWGKYIGHANYAVGTSLAYTKWFWSEHRFNEALTVFEDNHFVSAALDCQQIVSVDAGNLMVARVHEGNTVPKRMDGYEALPIEALPRGFHA